MRDDYVTRSAAQGDSHSTEDGRTNINVVSMDMLVVCASEATKKNRMRYSGADSVMETPDISDRVRQLDRRGHVKATRPFPVRHAPANV